MLRLGLAFFLPAALIACDSLVAGEPAVRVAALESVSCEVALAECEADHIIHKHLAHCKYEDIANKQVAYDGQRFAPSCETRLVACEAALEDEGDAIASALESSEGAAR